ncbi:DNA repair protein [Paenibacillus sonchi]|uniref:DNA repair protein n=2 Tax=Paenibacillus sonchi TaxID=373687 RepID=A0A974PBX3_9BACL|nr:JAB domain-containing protein [Paenibacillus sonchi]QQZ61157.1 DNA repair protein [Paenibacillus sonchi]
MGQDYLDNRMVKEYIQSLHQLTGIPLDKLENYGNTNNLMNALEHPHSLELTSMQLQKVEQLNEFLISHRVLQWEVENTQRKITSPDLAGSYFSAFLLGLRDRERFMVAFLDNGNHVIETRIISEGGLTEAPVYPRNILKAALNCDCTSIIMAHNHPGGSLKPSWEDMEMTKRMVAIFEPLHIGILDHIIIGNAGFTSLAQMGQLPKAAEEVISYEAITLKSLEEVERYIPAPYPEPIWDGVVREEEWER